MPKVIVHGLARPKRANYIQEWRKFRGIRSHGELTEKAGMSRATICRLENGTLPWRQGVLEQLSLALSCSMADLIAVNPFETARVTELYARIPEHLRPQALRTLSSFVEEAATA